MKKFLLLILVIVCANIYTNAQTWPQYYGDAGIQNSNSAAPYIDYYTGMLNSVMIAGSTDSEGAGGKDVYFVRAGIDGSSIITKTRGSVADEVINSICPFTQQSGYDIPNFLLGGYTTINGNKDVIIYVTDTLGNAALGNCDSVIISNPFDDELNCVMYATESVSYGAGYTTNLSGNKDFYFMSIMSSPLDTGYTRIFGGVGDDVATTIYGDGYQYWYMAGYSNSFSAGSDNDIYIVSYDESGDSIFWQKTYGEAGEDVANDIAHAYDMYFGEVFYVVGSTNSYSTGDKDVYILKLDAITGDTIWTKTYGGVNDDEASDILIQAGDGINYIIVSGYTTKDGSSDKDAYVLKLNDLGDTLWTKTFGQPGIDDIATTSIFENCEWYISGTSGDQMFLNKFPEPTIPLTFLVNDVSCFGDSDGSIELSLPLAYENVGNIYTFWPTVGGQAINGENNQQNPLRTYDIVNFLSAGYYVVIVDDNFCQTVDSAEVKQPDPLTSTHMQLTKGCHLASDKSAVVTPSGGTPPYSYEWFNTGIFDSIAYNLPAFNQDVYIYDNNGCSYYDIVPILDSPSPLDIVYSAQYDMSCPGVCDGSAKVTASGGSFDDGFGYNYYWFNAEGQNTDSISNLCTNAYHVTVIDSYECSVALDSILSVNEPSPTYIDFGAFDSYCNGSDDGKIELYYIDGLAPFTYIWSNGSTNDTLTSLTPGNYTVTVTNANGCMVDSSYSISEPTAIADNAVINNISCVGANDGSVKIYPSGGTSTTYNIEWYDYSTNDSISGLSAGTYSVTIYDTDYTCFNTYTYTITEPLSLSSTVSTTNISCWGDANGSATVAAIGGTTPYSYLWSNGFNGATYSGFPAGFFTVTITDANGCFTNNSATISQPSSALSASIVGTDVLCNGGTTGSADITVSGGTSGYTYSWSNLMATEDLSGISAGTYDVTVTDANLCTTTASVIINEPTDLTASAVNTSETINGLCDGTATVTGANGTSPYTYLWDIAAGSQATQTATALCVGIYSVTVTDANGCIEVTTVNIVGPDALDLTSIGSTVLCNGNCDGTVSVSATGGVTPYSYLWSDGLSQATQTATGLCAGTYTVTVTDSNGAIAITNANVTEPTQLSSTVTTSNVACYGDNTGSATVNASGGTTPYTYLWSNGFNGATYNGFPAGFFTVTITDANGCFTNNSATISQPTAALSATISGSDVLCYGASTGNVYLTVTGGTIPYSYNWSNGISTQNLTNVPIGTYSVTITDANNCQMTKSIVITEPSDIMLTTSSINSTCGSNNGTATVNATGGTGGYTYLWNNGGITASITGIIAGTYDITVTDGNSCSSSSSVVVNDITDPTLSVGSISHVNCFNSSNGSATIIALGGTTPFDYLWSNGNTTNSISSVSGGTYSMTATDANNCTATITVTINEHATALSTSIIPVDASCFGNSDASADLTVTGGTTPYSFIWNNTANTEDLSNLSIGTYIVTVTDNNGCNATNSVIISQPSQIFATISKTNISCFNLTDGSLTVSVNGGTSPYTYLWSNSVTTSSINNLSAAVYDITITDSNGCSIFRNDTITEPSAIVINFSSIQNSCAGANNGSLTASVTGGTQPYSYLWSTSATTQSINNLAAGNYDVTVTDANGCVASMTNFITQSPLINLTINGPSTTFCPGTSVTLNAQPTGGIPPFTFNWTDGYTTPAITVNPTTTSTYSVYVVDANGCTSSPQSKIVNIFTAPSVTMNASNLTICIGESVQIIAAVSGGSTPYSYTWNDIGSSSNIRTVNPTSSTTYVLSVTDNCSQQIIDSTSIIVNPLPTISGLAQYTGGTMTQGKVMAKLFSTVSIYDFNGFLSVDSAINGSDNKFYIDSVELGEYILKVTPTDNTYPTVLPTYYDTVLLSEYAIRLNVECGIDQDLTVVMKELQPASAGTLTISGRITVATNNKDILGEPIPGAEITLEQEPDDEPISNTETNSNGEYLFSGLIAAEYSIVVDIPGFPQLETHTIVIDGDTANINYVVDVTDSVGIYINHETSSVSKYELKDFSVNLYPVPFENRLNIDFSLNTNSDVNIELFDITGKKIESLMTQNLSKGNYSNSYQLENIINGIYFIKMKVGETVLLKKILKD
ncbi:MAG: hypothetical protein A2033_05645 [Bacteroidetes bacterium GWA2_31_9]|nr:MAG: hypothetical protein A2033_05645 [Bacteroidetes bacterium GWA2_31_9]